MTKQQRYNYSAKHIRRMKLFERHHLKVIFQALSEQIKPVIKTLETKGIQAAIDSLDSVQINSHLAAPIKDIYKDVGLYFANKTIWDLRQETKELKMGFGFNAEFLRDILRYFAQFLLNKVVLPISDTTKNQILKVLTDGMINGYGADKIARQLESPELMLWRARLIVRTESNKAMSYGQSLGESKSEWESNKIWIAANDHRTRHSHRDMDDREIPFNERYLVPIYKSVGGSVNPRKKGIEMQVGVDLMLGPGDPNASAENICNCRCTRAFKARRDVNGRLIKKTKPDILLPVEVMDKIKSYEPDYELKNNEIMDNAKGTAILQNTGTILEKVSKFEDSFHVKMETKIAALETEVNNEVKTEAGRTRRLLEEMLNGKSLAEEKKIDELIDLINSKEYSPEIKLQTDSEAVISQVNEMKRELVNMLTGVKMELAKKKRWVHTFERDKNELIKSITSEQL